MEHTPRLQRVIESAEAIASELGMIVLGVEHVVLAALRDGGSIPAQVAESLGTRADIESKLEELMSSEKYKTPTTKIGERS